MLQLRPNCECCGKLLAPDSAEALICSFDCTFCASCAQIPLQGLCPNCGGVATSNTRFPSAYTLLLSLPRSNALQAAEIDREARSSLTLGQGLVAASAFETRPRLAVPASAPIKVAETILFCSCSEIIILP